VDTTPSFIPERKNDDSEDYKITMVPLEKIRREDSQPPSKGFVENIRAIGIQQPPVLEKSADGMFIVVDGRRRIDAARMIGLAAIPARILNGEEVCNVDTDLITLAMNLQREANPGIEVDRIKSLLQKGMTQKELAEALGMPVFRLRRLFRLLSLGDEAARALNSGRIGFNTALVLSRLSRERQAQVLAAEGKLTLKKAKDAKRKSYLEGASRLFDEIGRRAAELPADSLSLKLEELVALAKSKGELSEDVDTAIKTLRDYFGGRS